MCVANRYIRAIGHQFDNRLRQLSSQSITKEEQLGEDFMVTHSDELPDPTDAVFEAVRGDNPRSDSRELLSEPRLDAPSSLENTYKTTLFDFAGA